MSYMKPNNVVMFARGISKSYKSKIVLSNVGFEIKKSEIIGLVGENGSGKSTLLKIFVGLLKPDSGKFKIEGKIGYCPQEMLLYDKLTVKENMIYFSKAYGIRTSSNEFESILDTTLKGFSFRNCINKVVSELSGGTKQKLNLALALIHNPDLLILDEPYSGFDWETYLYFWQLTEKIKSAGKSILVVSHLVNDYTRFDKLYKLQQGELKCV